MALTAAEVLLAAFNFAAAFLIWKLTVRSVMFMIADISPAVQRSTVISRFDNFVSAAVLVLSGLCINLFGSRLAFRPHRA